MDPIDAAFTTAVHHHQHGRLSAAETLYRLVLEITPEHPAALNNLGLIVPPAEAIGLLRRALAVEPCYVDALVNLSAILQAASEGAEAAALLQRAVDLIPADPASLFQLAHLLQSQGRDADAAAQYERAIELRPNFGAALCNLGTIHNTAERTAAASECYRRALAHDPTLEVANLNMVSILESDGRLQEATLCRDRVARPRPLQTEAAETPKRTVLVLANACVGNVPLDELMPRRTNTRITWHTDFATDAQASHLPPHDVAFNAVGNADLLDESFHRLTGFAAAHPMLNDADAVARTRRDRLSQTLHGLPGVVVPETVRLSRSAAMDLPAALAAADLVHPVLLRPVAGHGGEGAHLLETAEQIAAYRPGEADGYYAVAYHDCRHPDGHYRKYRTIFVDGACYPYHLAISDHWLVHYFSAAMLSAPWKRQEEHRFLADPASVLGPTATTALAAINQRLGLDFAGIDYTLLPDGRILVFEANATMLVHLRDSAEHFPYKHAHVPAIFDAFDAMLTRQAALSRIPHARHQQGLACPSPLP